MWPGVPIIPTMSGGYTDSRWLRNAGIPAYGVSGLFSDSGNNGVHGQNEHVGVKEIYDSKEFLYRLVKAIGCAGIELMQDTVTHKHSALAIDPVTLEVIRHGLVSIANQIDANIKRTAFSAYIYEYNDFAVGLTDADGKLIAQCTGGMPPFVADFGRHGGARRACRSTAANGCITATSCSAITPPCRASTSTTP